jgi:hypothetical protein
MSPGHSERRDKHSTYLCLTLQTSLQSAVTFDTIEYFMTCLPRTSDPNLRHPFTPPYHIFVLFISCSSLPIITQQISRFTIAVSMEVMISFHCNQIQYVMYLSSIACSKIYRSFRDKVSTVQLLTCHRFSAHMD